jgi:hypothetical protein
MKKLNMLATMALLVMTSMPAGAATIQTGLTQDTTGGATPIVKAKWEMNIAKDILGKYLGTDDASTTGAQFLPSGTKDTSKRITLCSIVTDPDGLADIDNVYADVFYPDNIALGSSHVPLPNQSNLGCGALMQEDALTRLSKADGLALFCTNIRNNNNNLPIFASPYTYTEICKLDGELQKETAAVYCGEKDLSYEDPAGDYKVWAVAQDKVGLQSKLENFFTYLPLTAFEADFNSINYGNVRLNTHKIINGDLVWNSPVNSGLATVRNIGNTRVQISVNQDDMGFGKTNGLWNVKYDARVGSNAAFAVYDPLVTTVLEDSLDLSELDEMDFSIDVAKFPPTHTGPYVGTMTLSGAAVAHLLCGPEEPRPSTLTVTKIVVGGNKQVSDFPLFVDGKSVTSGVATTTTAGNHTVSETIDPNYNAVFSGNCNSNGVVNVPANGSASCTITNTLKEVPVSHLTVHKVVVTHVEGTITTAADFQMTVDGNNVTQDVANVVTPGNHTVGEVSNPNYTMSFSAECPNGVANVPSGGSVTCTVTNTQKFATLTLNKVVNNTHGGNHVAADFLLYASGNDATTQLTTGVPKNVAVGSLFVNEQGVTGYQAAFSGDCDVSGQITLAAGDNKQCTITNTDLQPSITLVKVVDSGTASPLSFTLRVDNVFAPQSTSVGVTSNTAHAITEDAKTGYHFVSMSGTGSQGALCPATLGGTVTLNEGETITCTIHNAQNP